MPKNNSYDHSIQLDEFNKSTKWQNAIADKLDQEMDYETYKHLCHKSKAKPPTDFKKIRVHYVYDVKHDGRHKRDL